MNGESLCFTAEGLFFRRIDMLENGFYKIKPEFIELIDQLGGKYADRKERPVFCCIEDSEIKDLYWAIPTSDLAHRPPAQIEKIKMWNAEKGIRSSYYHIGYTNRPALYRISSCFPITEKYISCEYISQGKHLILKNPKEIEIIQKKLHRILFDESIHPDKYEQHITSLRKYLVSEINPDKEHTPFNDLLIELKGDQSKKKKIVKETER